MSVRRTPLRSLVLVVAGAALAACSGDQSRPSPTAPPRRDVSATAVTEAQLRTEIADLLPTQLQPGAQSRLTGIVGRLNANNVHSAQEQAYLLIDLVLLAYYNNTLQDPNGPAAPTTGDALITLVNDLLDFVGLPPSGINSHMLGPDGAVAVVGPRGRRVVTATKWTGIDIPRGAVDELGLLTIERIYDTFSPGQGPLPTSLTQYPPFYHYQMLPVQTFHTPFRIAFCNVEDEGPFAPPDAIHGQLRVAHPDPTNPATVQIGPRVGGNDIVVCGNTTLAFPPGPAGPTGPSIGLLDRGADAFGRFASWLGPKPAYAIHGGTAANLGSLSPFGTVDIGVPQDGPSDLPPPIRGQ